LNDIILENIVSRSNRRRKIESERR